MKRTRLLVILVIVNLMLSVSQPISVVADYDDSLPAFEVVTDQVGLDTPRNVTYTQATGHLDGFLGAGQAWTDFDADGYLDFYVTRHRGPNELYRGSPDGVFDVTTVNGDVGLADKQSSGSTFADYDNDGDQDLYVLNNGPNTLFRNDDGIFTDVTEFAGVGEPRKGSSGSWADFNKDGYLDLYVSNWMCDGCKKSGFEDMADTLYMNNGDGTFSDVSYLFPAHLLQGAGFIGSWLDYDNDGDLDLYIINDQVVNPIGNHMFRNDGPGCELWCFGYASDETNTNIFVYGMGVAIGDIDHDYDLDMYISNMGAHVMLLNDGNGRFNEETMSTNTGVMDVGWSTLFFDFDNNMYEDLFVAINDWDQTDSELHRNTGLGYFEEVPLVTQNLMAQGASYADYNNDGWMDLLISQLRGEYHILENKGYERSYSQNNWISFDLEGGGDIAKDPIGARLYMRTSNDLGHMKELVNGIGLGGGTQQVLHFGLASETVEAAVVLWPDGTSQTIEAFEINAINIIEYNPDGVMTHDEALKSLYLEKYHNPMLERNDVITLFLVTSGVALTFVILTPVITLRVARQRYVQST